MGLGLSSHEWPLGAQGSFPWGCQACWKGFGLGQRAQCSNPSFQCPGLVTSGTTIILAHPASPGTVADGWNVGGGCTWMGGYHQGRLLSPPPFCVDCNWTCLLCLHLGSTLIPEIMLSQVLRPEWESAPLIYSDTFTFFETLVDTIGPGSKKQCPLSGLGQ